ILLRLDDALAAATMSYRASGITVEHVLPQNPTGKWLQEWDQCWKDAGARRKWVNRLANLVLLDGDKNTRAGNMDFEKKKKVYFSGHGGHTPYVLTNTVLLAQDWSLATVTQRQANFLDTFSRVWGLEAVGKAKDAASVETGFHQKRTP